MKKTSIFVLALGLLLPAQSFAEQPGLLTNTQLSGAIYGGAVSKAQQRLGLGSFNGDVNVGRKGSEKRSFGFTRKSKKK